MNQLFILLLLTVTAHPLLSTDVFPDGLRSYKEKGYTKIQLRAQEDLPTAGDIITPRTVPSEKDGSRFDLIKEDIGFHYPFTQSTKCLEELNAMPVVDSTALIQLEEEDAPVHIFYRQHFFCEICQTYCIDDACGYSLQAVPEDGLCCQVKLKFNSDFPLLPLTTSDTATTVPYSAPESPTSTTISQTASSIVADDADWILKNPKQKKESRRRVRKPKNRIVLFHIG